MKHYETIDHTADLGIRVWGKTKKALFKRAAEAMFDLITDKKAVNVEKTVRFNLKAPDLKELFVSWLRELLYQYAAKGMLFKKIAVSRMDDTHISASASGEKLNPARHIFKKDIKAVTYHGLEIKKTRSNWQAQVIFDV